MRIFNNELMKIVSQEVSTGVSTMAVEYAEEGTLGPVLDFFLAWRLHDVEDDTHSVFVVISYDSLICVGSVAHDAAIFTNTAFCRLPSR